MGIAAGILLLASLTACQGGSGSVAESCWKKAKKADSLEDYMAENEDKVDLEALKQEASSADGPISQQFKAVAMLCAAEYRKEAGPGTTGGDSELAPVLASAAMATGSIDGVFMEVHQDPSKALSDGPNQIPLHLLEGVLKRLQSIHQAVQS